MFASWALRKENDISVFGLVMSMVELVRALTALQSNVD